MELTALRRPFIYFPLQGHFEQEVMVAGRIQRQQAGQRLRYADTTPAALAASAIRLLASDPAWPPIRCDGARRAAELINTLLPSPQHGHGEPPNSWPRIKVALVDEEVSRSRPAGTTIGSRGGAWR